MCNNTTQNSCIIINNASFIYEFKKVLIKISTNANLLI